MTKAVSALPTSIRCGRGQRTTVHAIRNRLFMRARSAMRAVSRLRTDAAGVAAIELSIIAPTLVLALICTADLGLGIYRNMQVQNAAQAGAEYAVTHGFTTTGIVSAVQAATTYSAVTASPAPTQFCGCASATGVATATCSSTCSGGSAAGTYVSVSALATYNTLLPYPLLPSRFTLTAQSTVRLQ
jgi:Flp pilus assembly protein TadG